MSDHFLTDKKGRCHTVITRANIYAYKGYVFEFHRYCGACKLKKDREPAARQGRKFFRVIDGWAKLSDAEKRATQISG